MKGNRFFRVMFGLALLACFCFYFYNRYITSPHSSDFDSEHAFVYSEVMEKLARGESIGPTEETVEAGEQPQPAEEPVQTAEPTPTEAPVEPTPQSDLPQIDIYDWQYMLVNASHPLGADYAPPQTVKINEREVDARIEQALNAFLQGCSDAGLPVFLSSGYRSYNEQSGLFQRKLGQGYTYEGASTIVAPPGTSEHQTGLACDITDWYRESKSWEDLEPTPTFQWLNEHCAEYGFILRYPKDKSGLAYDGSALTTVTGIIYEPWHFRYVGVEAATYIKAHNLCLEEFWELYVPGTINAAAQQ